MIESVINFVKEYPFCSVAIVAAVVCYVQRGIGDYHWFTVPLLMVAFVTPLAIGFVTSALTANYFFDKGWLPT